MRRAPHARTRPLGWLAASLGALVVWPAIAVPPPGPVPDTAREAVALCAAAERVGADDRADLLTRGLALAEEAVQDMPDAPIAQFALFCTLGKRTADAGLSWRTLWAIPRLRAAADRAVALAPDWADAMAAKGAFLYYLPRLLGGDAVAGERLLRDAITRDPGNGSARAILADVLIRQGRWEEGRAEAEVAHRLLAAEGMPVEAARVLALAAAQ